MTTFDYSAGIPVIRVSMLATPVHTCQSLKLIIIATEPAMSQTESCKCIISSVDCVEQQIPFLKKKTQ